MTVPIRNLKQKSIQTIEGTVVRLVDDDDFVLRDRTGKILVDADLDNRRLSLKPGETITVIGRLDDDDPDFDALRVTHSNGAIVYNRFRNGVGSSQDDVLTGSKRRDIFNGGTGNDQLLGRNGNDRLVGGAGDDVLIGGLGRDTALGGPGRDRFVYETVQEGGDRILDFSPASDVIDLRSIFARSEYTSTQPFTEYIRLTQVGANTQIQIDPDGNLGSQDFRELVTLTNITTNTLTSQNFVV